MKDDYKFTLTRHDQLSHVWKKVQAHLDYVIERDRRKNDSKASAEETAFTRGKIALAKELKGLDVVGEKDESEEDE